MIKKSCCGPIGRSEFSFPETPPACFVHLADHLKAGNHSPGIFMIRRRCAIAQVIAFLEEVSYRSEAKDWENRIEYIP